MEFYTQNGRVRPVRLCDETRKFAHDSLNRKYGLDTLRVDSVELDNIPGLSEMSLLEKYDTAILQIVENAPIRICDGEKLSGAATLGLAVRHFVPVSFGGNPFIFGISHLTVDFETVVKKGVNYIKEKAEKFYAIHKGTEREEFSKSTLNCIAAFEVWHKRYLDALASKPEYKANYENLKKVPFEPATNFYEAVQSIWFTFAFIRLCGNWPGIGRIDYLLDDYLKKDLSDGTLTLDEAREILAHFFIKGCEWVNGQYIGSGDAQHYQNLVISGIDEDGRDVTNEVTYLVLDVLEELGISDFPTTVRVNPNTDEKLLRRVAEVMRYGGGMLAIYSEDVVIESLVKDGYTLSEARKFANDGCWETQVPGKTFFIYSPFDAVQFLQQMTFGAYNKKPEFKSFDELYDKFIRDLRTTVNNFYEDKKRFSVRDNSVPGGWRWTQQSACTVVSLFEEGCIEKGYSYQDGGPVYNINALHIGGLADTVNSLYAIKKLVFDDGLVTLERLFEILKNNWEGEEVLRQIALNRYTYYGNDNDEVDLLCARILSDFADICTSYYGKCGYKLSAGVSTFGRQLEWSPLRLASPHGRRIGEVLAANCSPTPNTDKEGATAIIRSYCKADHTKIPTGAALDIKLLPSSVEGEEGLQALVALIRGFVALGGFFMQPDVVDASLLKLAQENPVDYQTLSVRVSGWNARFVTLDKEWQDMVIAQNEH